VINRRQLLTRVPAAAAAVAGFPLYVKAQTLGRDGGVAASNRVTIATIGMGWMGGDHLGKFARIKECQYVAVCDIDTDVLAAGKAKVDKAYGNNSNVAAYRAYEEVLFRKDIDAVTIALPDHWHGIASVMALRNGKDVYGEKPLAHTFYEGKCIVDTQKKYNRIWQTGSWQRSTENFRQACELVRNGRIGKITRIEVGLPSGHADYNKNKDQTAPTAPPATLNYDRWLGPAPDLAYCPARLPKTWRWNLNFGGGQLMDWIGHHVDIAHWGMGWDNTGPHEVSGVGEYPPADAVWNSATRYRIEARYPDNVTMVIAGGYPEIKGGTKWIGEKGWIWVTRGNSDASSKEILHSEAGAGEVHLPKTVSHYDQFIECVKSRGETLTSASVALHSAVPGWIGQIAMLTGRTIKWDPDKMVILGDAAASRMLSYEMRSPYRL
jgi:predicted dehydrogenase